MRCTSGVDGLTNWSLMDLLHHRGRLLHRDMLEHWYLHRHWHWGWGSCTCITARVKRMLKAGNCQQQPYAAQIASEIATHAHLGSWASSPSTCDANNTQPCIKFMIMTSEHEEV